MAIAYCSGCGEKVSTDASACPHCGKPLKDDELNRPGWVSEVVRNFAVISTAPTLIGSAVVFFYQRHDEARNREENIHRDAAQREQQEAGTKLSNMTERHLSKRPALEFQLATHESVLENVSRINTMYIAHDTGPAYFRAVRDSISDYDGRMAFVEDRKTEVIMEFVNVAIQLPRAPSSFRNADPENCAMRVITPVLALCMKLSIVGSWGFPSDGPARDDYYSFEYVSPLARSCAPPLSDDAQAEFKKVQASSYRNQKGGALTP